MVVLRFFLDLPIVVIVWFAGVTAIAVARRIVRFPRRRAFRSAVVAPPPPRSVAQPSWSLTLLVEVDEEAGLIQPSVQLRGSTLPFASRLRLDVVDERGAIRLTCGRSLPPWTIGTQLALPMLAAPSETAVEDVLRWHWNVVIEDWRGVRARWREHPAPVGKLNAEAELDLPGVAEI